jgi:hypothetical protein
MIFKQRFPLILGVGMVLGLVVGCQMLARGPSDEEQIRAITNKFVEAGNNQDLESLMSCFTEDFEGANGEDKVAMGEILEYVFTMDAGFDATNIVVDLAEDGKSAEVGNVDIMETPYALLLKKEGGTWLVSGYRQSL